MNDFRSASFLHVSENTPHIELSIDIVFETAWFIIYSIRNIASPRKRLTDTETRYLKSDSNFFIKNKINFEN